MKRIVVTLAALFVLLTLSPAADSPAEAGRAAAAQQEQSELARTAAIHREAFSKPFEEEAFRAYLATLPRDGDFYVVEGDMLLTEQELRPYLTSMAYDARPADPTAELIVAVVDGRKDIYHDAASRTLTYAVARSTFATQEQYDTAVRSMREATKAWEDACNECGVSYRHQPQHDAAPSNDKVNFTVRYHDSGRKYVAAAFFPHYDATRRFINLDPSFFSPGLRLMTVGVLRHELGHTLGYRHEHLQDIAPGCAQEKAEEPDRNWLALTPYDSKSVMHYFCGLNVGGVLNPRLTLSSADIAGHREQYKPQPPSAVGFTLPTESGGPPSALEVHREAFRRPADEAAVRAYAATLPKDGDLFVVEGDLRMTEQELRIYLRTRASSARPASAGDELPINYLGGVRDFYRNAGDRNLTYAVDRASFPSPERYDAVVELTKRAAKSWQDSCMGCGLKFTHQPQHDAAPSNDKVNFTVRHRDAGGSYAAAAFFPHDGPARRYLDVDPSFFAPGLKDAGVGVLRHALGHALGYRHANVKDVAGCRSEGGRWLPLTAGEPPSLMNYRCAGVAPARLELSDIEKREHRKTYGLARSSRAQLPGAQPELVIRFEGGDVAGHVAAALAALKELGLLGVDRHNVEPGETLEDIYKDKLDLPFFNAALRKLAGELNGANFDTREPRPGDRLLYPDVEFGDYEYSVKLDPSQESDQRRLKKMLGDSAGPVKEQKVDKETGITKLTFTGYELRVPVDSPERAALLRERLKGIPAEQILITSSDPTSRAPLRFFAEAAGIEHPADRFLNFVRENQPVPNNVQGFLGSIAGMRGMRDNLKECKRGAACPEIVLVDASVNLHPDLVPAVKSGGSGSVGRPELVEGNSQHFEFGSFSADSDHGTYMAGIIASQDNGYGLIGVHPAARIVSLDWNTLKRQQGDLADIIEVRDDLPAMQIYVFASGWKWDNPLLPPDQLVKTNAVSRKFESVWPLWITAAGNTDSGGRDIRGPFEQGPMNLGHMKNVVVVTAYRLDAQGVPHLLPDANYSTEGLVHIAAPGKNIPSTTSVSKYYVADGTSPATAFVAGTASAMVSNWDYYHRDPSRVKLRLQLTATPSLPRDGDARKVVTGILDPELALRDPSKAWLRNNGRHVEVNPAHWCAQSIKLVDAFGAPVLNGDSVQTRLIYRLYRIDNTDEWVAYVRVRGEGAALLPGAVRRIGPGRIVLNEVTNPTAPLFSAADGTAYTTGMFRDLLLSQGLLSDVCPQPQ